MLTGGERPFFDLAVSAAGEHTRVLVLGGYLGASIEKWLNLGRSEVVTFEPVGKFHRALTERFKHENRVQIIPAAAGAMNGEVPIRIDGDRSSFFSTPLNTPIPSIEIVKVWNLNSFLENDDLGFGVTEINIEGAEYPLISSLGPDSLKKLSVIFIQFHNFEFDSSDQLKAAEEHLSATHFKAIEYEFVWSVFLPRREKVT